VSEEHKKVKMSVSSKTLDPSSITQVKMSKHVLLTPGLSLEHDAFHFGSSCESPGASQHAIERFLDGDRIHPSTRARLARAAEKLERGHCERS
jgi:hypothetical protein